MSRLRRFAQPSEVHEPIELLRAGILFHARGVINARAIQHNLDWVWPFWVEKQFNPEDNSFIPRAFSISHVNLTHRNWTAVGHPEMSVYPLVDPRGLVTPHFDGWSLDFWIIDHNGMHLLPSREKSAKQEWRLSSGLEVLTGLKQSQRELQLSTVLEVRDNCPQARINISARSTARSWLVVSLRPYNPEGIQFVERLEFQEQSARWLVDNRRFVIFSHKPQQVLHSRYKDGDVFHSIRNNTPGSGYAVKCEVGMATGAALFDLEQESPMELDVTVPLTMEKSRKTRSLMPVKDSWDKALQNTARLHVPDERIRFLYDAAVRSLVLFSADDVVPGPYTYKRFWFRDACLMLHSMLTLGFADRCAEHIDKFPRRQKYSGYFHSQEGEWDSNGQVLWLMGRYQALTGQDLKKSWWKSMKKAVKWIEHKRLTKIRDRPHAGLLPAGFSAEHLGPNDYYYWDNFWSLAGLHAAAGIAEAGQDLGLSGKISAVADEYQKAIRNSIASIPLNRKKGGIPASPYRRMDSGAIGSLSADYPLQLYPPGSPEIINTAKFLMENCFYKKGFFQDMIHSGVNAYLTLAIAQTLLRHNVPGFQDLVMTIAQLASPTGQWPEAIHPITGGGCMGDGQHGWAAAEWIMSMRNMFVREENKSLILFSGVFPEWLEKKEDISFGPTLTPYGPVTAALVHEHGRVFARVDAQWHRSPQSIIIAAPGHEQVQVSDPGRPVQLTAYRAQ